MAAPVITQNSRFSGALVLRAAGTGSGTQAIASCNAVATETVKSLALSKASWSVANGGFWTVKRGSNTVLIVSGNGQAEYDKAGQQMERIDESQVDVTITLTNCAAAQASLVLKFHKRSDGAQYS